MDQMSYKAPNLILDHLVEAISRWFQTGGFETQVLKSPDGGVMIQARQQGTLRTVLGMAYALTLKLIQTEEHLQVEVGAAKWAESASMGSAAVAGTLTALGIWPAFLTSAYGSWKQSQLPSQAFKAIEEFVDKGQITVGITPHDELFKKLSIDADSLKKLPIEANPLKKLYNPLKPKVVCPSCGQSINANSKFCDQCGANLKLTCKCGAAIRPGAKFCENCGSPVIRG